MSLGPKDCWRASRLTARDWPPGLHVLSKFSVTTEAENRQKLWAHELRGEYHEEPRSELGDFVQKQNEATVKAPAPPRAELNLHIPTWLACVAAQLQLVSCVLSPDLWPSVLADQCLDS
ncbi:hypothetical protein MC885_001432 [Smutsia gigantea]|nr:hypothetical protein MC885_001432 [Smutsia gigantea]